MFGLPASTEYNKRIPKQKFYDNIAVTPAMKRVFVEKIKSIYWRNKISTSTINLAPGDNVTEIEVFEVKLEEQSLDETILRMIDRQIPYHIVFALEYGGKYQIWMSYKEILSNGRNACKVSGYYHTEWNSHDMIHLLIEGVDIDSVYENFIRQVMGDSFVADNDEPLKVALERIERRKRVKAEIERIEKRIWSETQPKKKYKLYESLKKQQAIWEEMNNGEIGNADK